MWTPDPTTIITAEQKAAVALASLQDAYTAAIKAHLDATANHGQYDGIQTAITYRDDPNPRYAAEGLALFNWRSAVWTYATAELDRVTTGQREIPTVEEFIAELPAFDWPIVD